MTRHISLTALHSLPGILTGQHGIFRERGLIVHVRLERVDVVDDCLVLTCVPIDRERESGARWTVSAHASVLFASRRYVASYAPGGCWRILLDPSVVNGVAEMVRPLPPGSCVDEAATATARSSSEAFALQMRDIKSGPVAGALLQYLAKQELEIASDGNLLSPGEQH
jgi:hypothetical protein